MPLRQILRSWLIPLVVGAGIFAISRPILADFLEQEEQLRQQLATQAVEVGSETVHGYQHVYYAHEGKKRFVTDDSRNSFSPVASGEYLAWVTSINGAGQIFLHDIPTEATVQLTHSSTNLNPSIHGNNVAWERWMVDRWQVFFFDGVRTVQLTEGDLAVEPHVTGEGVLFARKSESGEWRAERYLFASKTIELVETGLAGKLTVLRGGQAAEVPAASPSPSLESPSPAPEDIPTEEPTPTEEPPVSEEPTPSEEPSLEASPTPLPSEPPTVSEEDIRQELLVSPEPDLMQAEEEAESPGETGF